VRRWTQLTFVFRNVTGEVAAAAAVAASAGGAGAGEGAAAPASPAAPAGAAFIYSLYIDGKSDTEMTIGAAGGAVLANEGALWIGKDAQFAGATALLARLRIHGAALSPEAVRAEYLSAAALFAPDALTAREDATEAALAARALAQARAEAVAAGAAVAPLEDDARAPLPPSSFPIGSLPLLQGVLAATSLASAWGPWTPARRTVTEQGAAASALLAALRAEGARARFPCAFAASAPLGRGGCAAGAAGWGPDASDGARRSGSAGAGGAGLEACAAGPSRDCEVALARARLARSASTDESGSPDDEPSASTPAFRACGSCAEAEAWGWTLRWLGIAWRRSGGGGRWGGGGGAGGNGEVEEGEWVRTHVGDAPLLGTTMDSLIADGGAARPRFSP
jgi:hypothetical protein